MIGPETTTLWGTTAACDRAPPSRTTNKTTADVRMAFSIRQSCTISRPVKQLLILRHAKSHWGNPSLDDWERTLNERGERDAPRVGTLLREHSLVPDVIVTSDAVRARTTAQAAATAAGCAREIVLEPSLYLAPPDAILDIVCGLPDDAAIAMIVGHNPGLEDFVEQLSGEPQGLVTAALVLIEIQIDRWRDLDFSIRATIINSWRPRH